MVRTGHSAQQCSMLTFLYSMSLILFKFFHVLKEYILFCLLKGLQKQVLKFPFLSNGRFEPDEYSVPLSETTIGEEVAKGFEPLWICNRANLPSKRRWVVSTNGGDGPFRKNDSRAILT